MDPFEINAVIMDCVENNCLILQKGDTGKLLEFKKNSMMFPVSNRQKLF